MVTEKENAVDFEFKGGLIKFENLGFQHYTFSGRENRGKKGKGKATGKEEAKKEDSKIDYNQHEKKEKEVDIVENQIKV